MSESNKVDLKDVNKTKHTFDFEKFKTVFRRQKGQKRNEFGQFVSGGGGSDLRSKITMRVSVLVIALVAITGGLMVIRSYAGTSQPQAYWYDEASCNTKSKDYTNCIQNSTGALVYRAYVSYYGKEPAVQLFSINKQKLLNIGSSGSYPHSGRQGYQETIICELILSPECRATAQASQATGGANARKWLSESAKESLAKNLYKNALGRSPVKREITALVAGKQYSHTKMVAKFAKYPEVATVMNARFLTYLKSSKNPSNPPKEVDGKCPKDYIISRGGNNSLTVTWRRYSWDSKTNTCTYRDETSH